MDRIVFSPIGYIHTPFMELTEMPIQPTGAEEVEGYIELNEEYSEGLKDVEGFSHLHLFYYFHKSTNYSLCVKPFLDNVPRGLFSTRAPRRPNMLGYSVVEIVRVEGNKVHIKGVDMLDGTPLIDIKPYVEKFDVRKKTRCGWLEKNSERAKTLRSDDRFVEKRGEDE